MARKKRVTKKKPAAKKAAKVAAAVANEDDGGGGVVGVMAAAAEMLFEELSTLHVGVDSGGTLYGHDTAYGTMHPAGNFEAPILSLVANSADDVITLKLTSAIVLVGATINIVVAGTAVALTSADDISYTGTSIPATAAFVAAVNQALMVSVAFSKSVEEQLGADNEPKCVRVGTEEVDGSIPRFSTGLPGADYTNAYADNFPTPGSTNEVGGGCR